MTTIPSQPALAVPNANSPKRWRWYDVGLLIVVLAITTWVRATHIDRFPSFDELWHISTTSGWGSPLVQYDYDTVVVNARQQLSLEDARPIWSIWTDLRGVLHPPLFLMSLRVWRSIVGTGVLEAHWFSITWGTVALAFLFATARRAMDRWVATLLTLGMGVAQTQVYLAQEIRPYAMLNALGAIALWLMTRVEIDGPNRARAIALGAITLPLVMTHYFGFGGAMAVGIYGLARLRGFRSTFVGVAAAGAVFFCIAWVPIALRQTQDFAVGDVMMKTNGREPFHEALLVLAAPYRMLGDRVYWTDRLPVVTGVLFVLPWLLRRRFHPLLPWAVWLCASLGCLVTLDMVRSTQHVVYARYLSICSPAVPLLFAGVAWPFRRWLAYLTAVTVAALGLLYLITKNDIVVDAQDYAQVADAVRPRIADHEAILAYDVGEKTRWRPPFWIMTLACEPKVFPRTIALLTKPMTPAMIRQLEPIDAIGTRRAWLIAGGGSPPPDQIVPGSRVLSSTSVWEDIDIYRLEIVPAPATEPATDIATSGPAFNSAAPAAPVLEPAR